MNLGEMHDMVGGALARGTSLDTTEVPLFVRMAARKIERAYTFQYMDRFSTFTFDADSDYPRRVTFANTRIKRFIFCRIADDNGLFQYQKKIEPMELNSIEEGVPNAFWLDGVNYLIFNKTPTEDYIAEIAWHEYTNWPTDTSATTWLLLNAEDLLLAESILQGAAWIRDDKQLARWQGLRSEAFKSALDADSELRAGAQDLVMNYTGAFRDDR